MKPKSVLWVCGNKEIARRRAQFLPEGRRSYWTSDDNTQKIIWPGAAICGWGTDLIVLEGFDPDTCSDQARDWFMCGVQTKLSPDGRIQMIQDWYV